jgi:hypothetical protein
MEKIDANSAPEPKQQRSSFNSPVVSSNPVIEGNKTYKVFTENDGLLGMFDRKTAFAKVAQFAAQNIKARVEYVGKRYDSGFKSRARITD